MSRTAAALVLAVVLAACGSSVASPSATADPSVAPSTTARPTATASASPSPTPTPEEPATMTIERAELPEPGMNTGVTGVVPGGDGYVAIGFDGAYGSLVWTSADGRAWRDVTPDGFESIGLAGATVHDGRIVAVGRGDTINIEAERAAAFVSEDGLTWTEATGEDMRGQLIDVISTDDGLIAVGGVPGADAAGFWRSDDGTEWERIGEDIPGAFLWTLAEGGPGYVAVGWRRNPDPSVAVWTSTDGRSWSLAADPQGFTSFEATDVAVTPSGSLVMVGGNVFGGEGRIWTSADAETWTVAEVEGGMTDAGARSVIATDAGLLAVGSIGMDGAAWLSTDDGATWTLLATLPETYFDDALATDDGIIISGATQTGTLETGIDSRASLWLAAFE